jgi:putative FmdB family regulatory protein
MPTYEFECRDCQEHFEVKTSFSSTSAIYCPRCSSTSLKKIFGNVAIVLRGPGFYKTDSRNSASSTKLNGSSEAKSNEVKSNGSGEARKQKEVSKPPSSEKA